MKEEDISRLLQRYLSAREIGKEPYFDADELDELLGSFEESNDYKYYEELLNLGLKLHPGNTELQIRQCKFYVYNDDYESALALIDAIAEKDNQDLDMLRLECYCMIDRYDQLIEYTERLIYDNCDHLEAVFEYIAPLLGDMEMHDEALDFISRGVDLFPKNMTLKNELCYNKELKGDIDGAISVCNSLIDKNPYSHDYWFALGRLYSMKAEYDKAIEAFDFALTCDDSDPELKILKAYCHYMNENYEKALEVYLDIDMDTTTNGVLTENIKPLMGECYTKMGNFEGAYVILKDFIEHDTSANEPAAYINFVQCCAHTNRLREGSKALEKAVELFPSNVRVLSILALTYLQNGEDKLAIETTERLFDVLEKVDQHHPDEYESIFHAGQRLYMNGDFDKALKYYNKVYALNPEYPFIHLHLAMANLATGDMKRFSEHFRQTSPKQLIEYLENSGIDFSEVEKQFLGKHIPPEDLTKEFLNNKDNNN